MIQESIRLSAGSTNEAVNQVQAFVSAMEEFDFAVDLSSGRYVVNGKSIMGILSLDLAYPITVTAQVPDQQRERFLQVLHTFK